MLEYDQVNKKKKETKIDSDREKKRAESALQFV